MEWQFGDTVRTDAVENNGDVMAWFNAAQAAYPDNIDFQVALAPRRGPIRVETAVIVGIDENDAITLVTINPETSEVIGRLPFTTAIPALMLALHTSLFLPLNSANAIIIVIGAIAALSIVVGLIVWWPRANILRALTLQSGKAGRSWWRQWHVLLGVYSFIVIFLVTLSGIHLMEPDLLESAVGISAHAHEDTDGAPVQQVIPLCKDAPTLAQILDLAMSEFPNGEITQAFRPGEFSLDAFEIRMTHNRDGNTRYGDTILHIDPECDGKAVIVDGRDFSAGQKTVGFLMPLHGGRGFGSVGEIFVALSGVAFIFYGVSGVVMWTKRRKRKNSAKT